MPQNATRKICDSRRYDEHWYYEVVKAKMRHISQWAVKKVEDMRAHELVEQNAVEIIRLRTICTGENGL